MKKAIFLGAFLIFSSANSQVKQPTSLQQAVDQVSGCGIDFEKVNGTRYWPNGLALYGDEYNLGWTENFADIASTSASKLKDINNELAKNNFRLIILPIPNRLSMLPSSVVQVTGLNAGLADNAYSTFLKALTTQKLEAIDALSPFRQSGSVPLVFLTEAHWTEDGAAKVAAIAAPKLVQGQLNVRAEPIKEIRSPGLSKFAREAFSQCKVLLPVEEYKDYKFYTTQRYFSTGFSGIEDGSRVWSLGPSASLSFSSTGGPGQINLTFDNPVEGQTVVVRVNNKIVQTLNAVKVGTQKIDLRTVFVKGMNTVQITSSSWNWRPNSFAGQDPRPLALYFSRLQIVNPDIDFLQGLEPVIQEKAADLLSDVQAKNILVGSSYSEESDGNNLKFANFLRMYAHADVLNYARGAGGITAAIRDFIESDEFSSSDKRTLLWEFPLVQVVTEQQGLDQIIAALQFKRCGAPTEISNSNKVLSATTNTIYQITLMDKSATTLIIKSKDNFTLTNNDRQDSRNKFYYRSSAASDISFIPSKGGLTIKSCQLVN